MKKVITFYRIYEIPDEESVQKIHSVEGEDAEINEIKICDYAENIAKDLFRNDLEKSLLLQESIDEVFSSELITILEERLIEDADQETEN
jgi:hypothetical protein